MKKTIKLLSIASIAIAALSLLMAAGFLSFLWEPVCLLYSSSRDVAEVGPIIPAGNIVYMVGCLIVAVIVRVCSESSRAIVMEIISIIFLSAVLPVIAWFLEMVQTVGIGQTAGASALAALSVATTISSLTRSLMDVSVALSLVVCGMSISEKISLNKRA